MKGAILTNASSPNRSSTDFYPTPEDATFALVDYLKLKNITVWEPACGQGHMVKALIARGLNCFGTELNHQDFGEGDVNFLTCDFYQCDWIITNPPFSHAEQFIDRCLDFKRPFAMLLKSQYWHSKKRVALFEKHRPSHILPLTWRPDFSFSGGSPTMDVLWTVWDTKPHQNVKYQPLFKPKARIDVWA